ncbi:MAG: hypothetical protein WCD11_02060 [Solirubrobacteraceae bacterium]
MNTERPLGDVLAQARGDFIPQRPELAPWARSKLTHVRHASTGNVVTVPLIVADRVRLHGLDRALSEQDDFLEDWTRDGWGVAR